MVMEAVAQSVQVCPDLDKRGKIYQCGSQLICHGIPDDILVIFYDRAKKEGILKLLFYERDISIYEFLTLYRNPATNAIACYHENPETKKWVMDGMGWANEITRMGGLFTRVNVGQGFFRGICAPNFLLRYCHMMVEWVFDNLNADVVHGVTPVSNRAASIFVRKLGFDVVGPLRAGTVWEGRLEDVWLSSMTEEMWDKKSPWRRK